MWTRLVVRPRTGELDPCTKCGATLGTDDVQLACCERIDWWAVIGRGRIVTAALDLISEFRQQNAPCCDVTEKRGNLVREASHFWRRQHLRFSRW